MGFDRRSVVALDSAVRHAVPGRLDTANQRVARSIIGQRPRVGHRQDGNRDGKKGAAFHYCSLATIDVGSWMKRGHNPADSSSRLGDDTCSSDAYSHV